MKCIIIKRTGGKVYRITPFFGVSIQKVIDRDLPEIVKTKGDIPDVTDYVIIDISALPDRYFREAWVLKNNTCELYIPKCRSVHIKNIRKRRDAKWKNFDRRYLSAQRDNKSLTDLNVERATLKNAPSDAKILIDSATTPGAIKEVFKTF